MSVGYRVIAPPLKMACGKAGDGGGAGGDGGSAGGGGDGGFTCP